MAWCRQATSGITWANVDPDLYRHMASLGYNELNTEDPGLKISRFNTQNINLQVVFEIYIFEITVTSTRNIQLAMASLACSGIIPDATKPLPEPI